MVPLLSHGATLIAWCHPHRMVPLSSHGAEQLLLLLLLLLLLFW
jgi:hypothetical protein